MYDLISPSLVYQYLTLLASRAAGPAAARFPGFDADKVRRYMAADFFPYNLGEAAATAEGRFLNGFPDDGSDLSEEDQEILRRIMAEEHERLMTLLQNAE